MNLNQPRLKNLKLNLILTCNICTVPYMSTVSQEGWKAGFFIIEAVTCTVYFTGWAVDD